MRGKVEPLAFVQPRSRAPLLNYLEVAKPRETALITFIGAAAALVAGPSLAERWLLAVLAIALGSAGTNGLTNYLDRDVDARMQRTQRRALPSRRIYPPERALPWMGASVVGALALAWVLNPWAFAAGLMGVVAALVARKSGITHLLGGIAGSAPVLVGWLAVNPPPSPTLGLLCLLVFTWVPLHVWSLMLAYREEYQEAGVNIFPLTWRPENALKVLFALSLLLYALSLGLYFIGSSGPLYLVMANLLGWAMLGASFRLLRRKASRDAWRVYKLSAYPYLGLLFLSLALGSWL